MRKIRIYLLAAFALQGALVHAQTTSRPLVSLCDLVSNPKKYDKKVVYVTALMDAHVKGRHLRPTGACATPEFVAFTTDEDFKIVNDPYDRDKFWAALEPVAAIQKVYPEFSYRYAFILRTPIKLKGYFVASKKREFGAYNSLKFAISIRQILEIGDSKLVDVSGKEYFNPQEQGDFRFHILLSSR